MMLCFVLPKGVLEWLVHNPNACATQNYRIIEDFSQIPCAMSSLEVLQRYPTQQKTLSMHGFENMVLVAHGINSRSIFM